MPRERLVIIGGVAAGMSAASRARRQNSQLEIVVIEKGRHVSYGACGLPYFLSGQIAGWKNLLVYSPEFFREKRGIQLLLEHEAVQIEPGRKTVHTLAADKPVSIPYDKLVIATGGAPARSIPGSGLSGVFTCNDLDGAIRLRAVLDERRPKRAVIIGSGYIGLEVADAFIARGIQVTVLERSDALLEGLDPELGAKIESVLQAHGVALRKNSPASAIAPAGTGDSLLVQYGAGAEPADIVLLATGIQPQNQLAEEAGIPLGSTGAIAVDDRMLTGVNGIYAAGDCVEARHLVTGKSAYFPLGTTANKQGRVAGENAAGGNARFEGIVGTLVTKIFELELAKTGLGLAQARSHGFDADSLTLASTSRAHYFHGKPLLINLVWDRSTARLLGCQMAGEEGVAKRIDVAAMALHARLRIPEMLHLDLSYAPPFAPVWEPILVAANEALKKLRR